MYICGLFVAICSDFRGEYSSRSTETQSCFLGRTALHFIIQNNSTSDLVLSPSPVFSDLWWHSPSSCLCCSSSQPLSTSWTRWTQPWTSHTHKTLGRCYAPTSDTPSSSLSLSKTACSTTQMSSSRLSLWMVSPRLQGELNQH